MPETYREGGKVVLPVTFLDGATAELVYDPKLGLAERGVWAMFAVSPADGPGRGFIAVQGDIGRWIAGDAPADVLQGADGAVVTVWTTPDGEPAERLVYEFGPWRVLAPQDGAPARWATAIAGRTTEDGFLVVEGREGFAIAPPGGEGQPQLILGDLNPEGVILNLGTVRPPTRPAAGRGLAVRRVVSRDGRRDGLRPRLLGRGRRVRRCGRRRTPHPHHRTSLTRWGSLPPS